MAVALTALIALRSVGRRNEQVGVGAIENNNEGEVKGGRKHFILPRAVHSAFYILIRLASHHITLKPKQFSRGGRGREAAIPGNPCALSSSPYHTSLITPPLFVKYKIRVGNKLHLYLPVDDIALFLPGLLLLAIVSFWPKLERRGNR